MLLLYDLGIRVYSVLAFILSFFNKKAKAWVNGRADQTIVPMDNCTWYHFASLGEFEQGRPVIEMYKSRNPEVKVVITFFSPSGYEIRKNSPLADHVYYLPSDTGSNARHFIDIINPTAAVFTKYEYWYHYFDELHKRNIPIYMISAIFQRRQAFFKWYGGLHRKMLKMVRYFYVQDFHSIELLNSLGITNATVSGDTRFDRVWANAGDPNFIPEVEYFKNGQKLVVAGSTWPEGEKLLAAIINDYPDWKWVFAPHEVTAQHIEDLKAMLPAEGTICFSKLPQNKLKIAEYRILILDNVGMLSSIYQYGDLAYIGGGFGRGIHNILEAGAFGLPVIFGPNYQAFKEAKDVVALGAGISVSNTEELKSAADKFMTDDAERLRAGKIMKDYVKQNTGATEKIFNSIRNTDQ
ncbi:3-deoxy-D-manno-octulosonic acid transferase [Mucilaginibacter ginkgonis]|uniref:3-deoxy-D-manno-octulosonic acid transferase n=1 Tax=Mucilaginibacter ginkgonis TaxID=2682091 RepID=A0A6I4I0F2_9SPHI|nr:glycosyltransferase N-terminal domain-containing protein [Mucilaginibacter ginkgonis]QQL48589.1 3-deoxy-D-manno-octulosonic acid transferase [Mucilaginibacter ginkgonis]